MPHVQVKKDEPFESALRRFKKQIEREGVLKEIKDRKYYEKPSQKKRKRVPRSSR